MLNFIEINKTPLTLDRSKRVIKREQYCHYLNAQAIIAQAQQQAKEIVASAERAKQQARDEGYNAGYDAAMQDQSETLLTTLTMCQKFMTSRQNDMAELVMEVSRKLFGDLDIDTRVIKLIQQALTSHYGAHNILLRVAPIQVLLVQKKLKDFSKQFPGGGQLDVIEDERVEPGTSLLETPIGVLNASLETQLTAIENSLGSTLDIS